MLSLSSVSFGKAQQTSIYELSFKLICVVDIIDWISPHCQIIAYFLDGMHNEFNEYFYACVINWILISTHDNRLL